MSSVGFATHRPRDAHALLFAGGELQRTASLLAEQPHLIEGRAHALVDLRASARRR